MITTKKNELKQYDNRCTCDDLIWFDVRCLSWTIYSISRWWLFNLIWLSNFMCCKRCLIQFDIWVHNLCVQIIRIFISYPKGRYKKIINKIFISHNAFFSSFHIPSFPFLFFFSFFFLLTLESIGQQEYASFQCAEYP